MAWKLTVADKSFLLDDLTEDDLYKIASAHEGTDWLRLYLNPAAHPGAFYDLLALVALKLEVAPPPRPNNIRETVALLEAVSQVDDDLPKAFGDGGLPLVNTEDDPATSTSSTSTVRGDGIRTRPAPRRSETGGSSSKPTG